MTLTELVDTGGGDQVEDQPDHIWFEIMSLVLDSLSMISQGLITSLSTN